MLVLNERKWAERVFDTGDLGDKPAATVFVLARYLYHVEGLKRKKIIEKLDVMLSQILSDYSSIKWMQILEKAATTAKKRPLIEIESIPVTRGELDSIEALGSSRLRRLGFTMVVVAKYFNILRDTNNNWINLEVNEIFDLACINATLDLKADMYRDLIDADFIQYSRKVGNNNARVLVLDDTEPVLFVDDLRAVGHAYQLYCGEPYFKCERCGVLTRQNKNKTKKYCADCAKAPGPAMRKFTCIDCGREVFVVTRNSSAIRCLECQKIADKRYHRDRQSKYMQAKMTVGSKDD